MSGLNNCYVESSRCEICYTDAVVIVYDDGEYYPKFCKGCLTKMIKAIDDYSKVKTIHVEKIINEVS